MLITHVWWYSVRPRPKIEICIETWNLCTNCDPPSVNYFPPGYGMICKQFLQTFTQPSHFFLKLLKQGIQCAHQCACQVHTYPFTPLGRAGRISESNRWLNGPWPISWRRPEDKQGLFKSGDWRGYARTDGQIDGGAAMQGAVACTIISMLTGICTNLCNTWHKICRKVRLFVAILQIVSSVSLHNNHICLTTVTSSYSHTYPELHWTIGACVSNNSFCLWAASCPYRIKSRRAKISKEIQAVIIRSIHIRHD